MSASKSANQKTRRSSCETDTSGNAVSSRRNAIGLGSHIAASQLCHGIHEIQPRIKAGIRRSRRDNLRFHRERGITDQAQIALRRRLDNALDRVCTLELVVEIGRSWEWQGMQVDGVVAPTGWNFAPLHTLVLA